MEETLRILKMVEDGSITAGEAAGLMDALKASVPEEAVVPKDYDQKMFRVIVDSPEGDKVNIQFPMKVVKNLIRAAGRLPIPEKDLKGVDLSDLMDTVSECLDQEIEGDFVNVSAADGTIVRIYVDN